MSGSIPEIRSEYSPSYKRINVAGFFGGISPSGVEAAVYSQEKIVDKVIASEPPNPSRMALKRTIECELVIDPMEMKSIHLWLTEKIKEYEQLFGTIPSPEEIQSKRTRPKS